MKPQQTRVRCGFRWATWKFLGRGQARGLDWRESWKERGLQGLLIRFRGQPGAAAAVVVGMPISKPARHFALTTLSPFWFVWVNAIQMKPQTKCTQREPASWIKITLLWFFIHGTIVPRDNSIGKLLITGDNIISLLQNKRFSFSKVLSSVTCNISAYTAKAYKIKMQIS